MCVCQITPKQNGDSNRRGVSKELRYKQNNIIISDSVLCTIIPPQLKKMSSWYKVMGRYKCFISAKSMNYSLLTWCGCYSEKLKYQSHNVQNRSIGEITSRIFVTYNNYVRPHSFRIHKTSSYMAIAKTFPYP